MSKYQKAKETNSQNKDFMYIAIGFWIVAGVLLAILLIFKKEITKAINIISLSF